jgi:hypothetical protein
MRTISFLSIATAAAISMLLVPALSGTADARGRDRSGAYTTGRGHTGTYSSNSTGHLRDGKTRDQSITTQNGKTYNRTVTGTYDKETGAFNKQAVGPHGNTRTYTGTANDGQFSGNYETSTGKSGTFDMKRSRNDDGSVTRDGTWTNKNDVTRNRSVTTDYDPETRTITRSVTGPQGNTRDGSATIAPDSTTSE